MKTLVEAMRAEAARLDLQAAECEFPIDAFIDREIAQSLRNVTETACALPKTLLETGWMGTFQLAPSKEAETVPRKTAEVMNGQVRAGDTIVYPGRWGSSLWTNIATVLEVLDVPVNTWLTYSESKPALKIEVLNTTGFADTPYKTTIHVLDRVVKL